MGSAYQFERLCISIRHSPMLKALDPLWNFLRPFYDETMRLVGRHGLERRINGTDTIKLCQECRQVGETYEPAVWARVMSHIRPDSRAIDVGAHVGLYAVALGQRVGPGGMVLAAEPDPENRERLLKHIALNGLQETLRVIPAAMSDVAGSAMLSTNSLQSHITSEGHIPITLETLDAVVGNHKWHLLIIDVEGHEEHVLRGGYSLLADPQRRPDMIVVEVHPYAWPALGVSSESLLRELTQHGYRVESVDGQPVHDIPIYGHIVAVTS